MASNSSDSTYNPGSTTTGDTLSSTQSTGSSTLGSSSTYGSTPSGTGTGQSTGRYSPDAGGYSRQPAGNFGKSYRPQSSETLMERARDNKTGIAVAVAIGAVAAAAIPYLFSSRKNSSARREVDTSVNTYGGSRDRYDTGRASSDLSTSDTDHSASSSLGASGSTTTGTTTVGTTTGGTSSSY